MTTLAEFDAIAAKENGLVVISTVRADQTVQASLVNAGIVTNPLSGDAALAFVTYGRVKLANLRARRQVTATARSGWTWATIEGRASIIGPDDPHRGVTGEQLRALLRQVFVAAGGTHDDWAEYDRAMTDQRRAVVLVAPVRIYSN